jgi:hypothetical protein
MNDLESRLRQAVQADADRVRPDEFSSLDTIRARTRTARMRRRSVVATLGAALVVAAGAVALPRLGDDDNLTTVPPATDDTATPTTDDPAPGTPTTTPVTPSVDRAAVLWPDPDDGGADTPAEAAEGFLSQLLGVENPTSDFETGANDTGTIDVYGVGENGQQRDKVVSTIHLMEQPGDGWYVTHALSTEVVIESPEAKDTVGAPLTVRGRGRGFEGNIIISMHDRFADDELGQTFTPAGCCEELVDFEAALSFEAPDDQFVMLLAHNDSGIAAIESFTAIPLLFGAASDSTSFDVFFHDNDDEVVAFPRSVPKTSGVLRAALSTLLEGPTASERAAGVYSFFSDETADMLLDVTISDGVAVVSFDPEMAEVLNNASTSAGSEALLTELNFTVFQFETFDSVEYHLGDSCENFGSWLQLDTCEFDRP